MVSRSYRIYQISHHQRNQSHYFATLHNQGQDFSLIAFFHLLFEDAVAGSPKSIQENNSFCLRPDLSHYESQPNSHLGMRISHRSLRFLKANLYAWQFF